MIIKKWCSAGLWITDCGRSPCNNTVAVISGSKYCLFREERRTADGKCDEDVKIVAVDLQAMAPIPGVIQIQGDITKVGYRLQLCDQKYSSL